MVSYLHDFCRTRIIMRIFKALLYFLTFLFIFTGCLHSNKVARKTAEKDIDLTLENLIGEYKGKMPCADCEAIETSLLLTDLQGYQLKYRYVGKSDQLFERVGNWRLEEDHLVLEGIDYMYKVGDELLRQLDLSGNEITGEIAERYVLLKIK